MSPNKVLYTLSISATIIFGCGNHQEIQPKEKFSVTDSLLNKLEIDTVQGANNLTELSFSAKISANEDQKTEVFPLVGGNVSNVRVNLGDKVSRGQVLALLNSAEMADYEKEVIATQSELKNAERNLTQTKSLFDSGLSSAKDLEEAKNNYAVKQAEYKKAQAVIKLNGGKSNGSYAIKSPINGFVIDKKITTNMQLRPDNENSLFSIADLSTVWALINVYESDVSNIAEGNDVKLHTLSYPDEIFTGKIDYIYNQVDADSKVVNARVKIANPKFLLKPGMMASVKVTAKSKNSLPTVNPRGIVFDNNKNYVLVIDSAKRVQIRPIEVARKTSVKAYISNGLKVGDRVVASKQVFLYENLKNQ